MNHKEMNLGNIASIGSGLVIRRKQAMNESEAIKKYPMLTLKSFEQSGLLNSDEFEDFLSNEVLDDKYLTQKGDVIVRLSHPNTAVTIDEENIGILIPSLFAIIRLDTEEVLPKYLSIFLNSEHMKRIYSKSSIGSAIQIIKTSMLKDIEIAIKSLDKQKKIIELNELIIRERILLEKLLEEKLKYHTAILNKVI